MKKKTIVINTSNTQYDLLATVPRTYFHWVVSNDPNDDSDIYWMDTGMTAEILSKMRNYQRVNHFPGMNVIARKDYLARYLNYMQIHHPCEYNFYPRTWTIPRDMPGLRHMFSSKKPRTFIVKPEASCQGRGIFLTRKLDDVPEKCVVQRYIHQPYLIDNLKFDLRIYVLVTSCDPLRVYMHKEGLVRLATEEYQSPLPKNLNSLCSHLTNYAINKTNPNFIFNKDSDEDSVGHKRSLTYLNNYFQAAGENITL